MVSVFADSHLDILDEGNAREIEKVAKIPSTAVII